MARITIRIDLSRGTAIGPGKIRLLELIEERGSISGAGRAMDMSYRRAWLLVDELNRLFRMRVVTARPGGGSESGARLTPFGRDLVQRYRRMERKTHQALAEHLESLDAATSLHRAPPSRVRKNAQGSR